MANLKLRFFKTIVSGDSRSFLFLFFLFYGLSSTATIVADDNDGAFMSKLLEALTPTPPGWSQNTFFCKWKGVKCGNKRVTSIDLHTHSLTGTLPSGLNTLSFLTYLDLSENYLTGPFPSLTNLTLLKKVYLGHNNFTSIPNETCFQGLTNLRVLSMESNTNLAPWTFPNLNHSLKLEVLALQATNMEGTLPETFHLFHKLTLVFLSRNNITGTLPESFAGSSISMLSLNNQKVGLSGPIGVLSKMTQLTTVTLDNNMFTGPIPNLSDCQLLFNLQLQNNQLTGAVPPSLTSIFMLRNLSLENNLLRGPLPKFDKQVKVTYYPLNRLCPHSSDGLCDLTVLLDIAQAYGNPLQLMSSWKWNNPCQNWGFIVCGEGEKVTDVNLSNQGLTGTISAEFGKLSNLKRLSLSGNHLSGSIPVILTSLGQLEALDVSYNNLSGVVPNEFPSRVKLNTTGNPLLRGPGGLIVSSARAPSKTTNHWIAGVLAAAATVGVVMIIVIVINRERCCSLVKRGIFMKTRSFLDNNNVENFMKRYSSLAPKRYSYSDVKRMTKSFRDKLGKGGFGVVYKASLPDGRLVAIKMINESKGSGEEFINEVASISKTSHVNIVSLLGFCYERNKRALIYEFMSNGSLDKFIYKRESPNAFTNLDWNILYKIALGIAKGLEYLHQGCSTRIVHLDIKPQNILLDEDFCPKISDFGLAKLCRKKESIVSILGTRGTIGYIAPEVLSRRYGGVSHKSDVYSYGMLILEMVGVRKNHGGRGSHTSEMFFPDWIYKDLEQDNLYSNHSLITQEDNEIVRKMTMVSLWCIQTNPRNRPSVSKVIEMLEGPLESVPFPPKPTYSPNIPPLKFSETSSSSKYVTKSSNMQKDVPFNQRLQKSKN